MNENKGKVDMPNLKGYSLGFRVKNFFKQKMPLLILSIGLIFFMFYDAIKWKINSANFWVLLFSMLMTFFFYMYAVTIMGKMGLKAGKDSPVFIETLNYYASEKEKIEPIRNYLGQFCAYKTRTEKEKQQEGILDGEGLLFSKLNSYKKENLTKSEWKAVCKARKLKVTRLLEKDLVSERGFSHHSKDATYLGKSEYSYARQRTLQTGLNKLLIPIALTYIGIESINMANVLAGCIKAVLILFSGLSNYLSSEEYVINELRNRFINKADCLAEFRVMFENKEGCFACVSEEPKGQAQEIKQEEPMEETQELNPVEPPKEEANETLLETCKKVDREYSTEDIANAKSKEDLPLNSLPNTLTLEEKKQIIMALLELDSKK